MDPEGFLRRRGMLGPAAPEARAGLGLPVTLVPAFLLSYGGVLSRVMVTVLAAKGVQAGRSTVCRQPRT